MKKWNITITAKNEKEALKLINLLNETFKFADKVNEPLHHIYADINGKDGDALVCEEDRNFNK